MKPIDLKPLPCPFCGVEPEIVAGEVYAEVYCGNEGCVTYHYNGDQRLIVSDGMGLDDPDYPRGPEVYKQLAIERWNRRA